MYSTTIKFGGKRQVKNDVSYVRVGSRIIES